MIFLDRDLESWIEIRIEFPFWQNSRLSINCVKRNGNGSEVISRSNKGRIWVIEEYNQANRCLSIRQCRNRLARNKLCLANQNPYTQSDKRNFLFVFVHVFWDNYFWEYFETSNILTELKLPSYHRSQKCHRRIYFAQHKINHL